MSTKDGGPAFPCQALQTFHGVPVGFEHSGMTMRDYFAAKAMPAHCAGIGAADLPPAEWHAEVARLSYQTADAMLAEREAQS